MEPSKPADYLDRVEEILPFLRKQGGLGAILVDLTPLNQVEMNYGSKTAARSSTARRT